MESGMNMIAALTAIAALHRPMNCGSRRRVFCLSRPTGCFDGATGIYGQARTRKAMSVCLPTGLNRTAHGAFIMRLGVRHG